MAKQKRESNYFKVISRIDGFEVGVCLKRVLRSASTRLDRLVAHGSRRSAEFPDRRCTERCRWQNS